ncbi:MAG: 1-phosphofructokinase family hexose kinase [Sphingobacteriia bacterium]|nr:1-phosphofructokinase family hexose kinase [Sphingobacteriia bacterium]
MEKIITLTLNPAIDKTTTTEKIEPEKKLKCVHPTYEPGGGGINVSRALQHLGKRSCALYFGGGFNGPFFKKLLEQEQVVAEEITVNTHIRTNIIVFENASQQQYRFGMESQPVAERDWQLCLQILDEKEGFDFLIASGSLPQGVPADFFGRVAAIVKKKNAKLIVDTSGNALQKAIEEGVFLIKPNVAELGSLYGKETLTKNEIRLAVQSVIAKGGCEVLVVSLGSEGAILATKEVYHHITPPKIKVMSTVGAGDSMVAGLVYALSEGMCLRDVLKYGVACGSSATMHMGTALCQQEDVTELLKYL